MDMFTRDVADFLIELHVIDASDGPLAGAHNFYRGGSLAVYDAETREAITLLSDVFDPAILLSIWDEALESRWAADPACDLVLFWTFFHSSARELFRSLLSFDSGTWARARGWALWKALITYRDLRFGDPALAEDVRALIHSIILFP